MICGSAFTPIVQNGRESTSRIRPIYVRNPVLSVTLKPHHRTSKTTHRLSIHPQHLEIIPLRVTERLGVCYVASYMRLQFLHLQYADSRYPEISAWLA